MEKFGWFGYQASMFTMMIAGIVYGGVKIHPIIFLALIPVFFLGVIVLS